MWKFVVCFGLLTVLANKFRVTCYGSNIEANPLTYTAAILKNQKPKCLGIFVDEKFIATSAHCVYGSAASSLSIKIFESNNGTTDGVVYEVLKVIVHPYYTPPSPDYDIALLKIKSLSTSTPLSLGKTEPSPKDTVQTISWNLQDDQSSPQLVMVKIEDRKSCKDKVGKFVSGRMICAYEENSAVKSDGPLIFNEKLIGIHSKRFESNQGALPTIYTNIANSEIYSFIEMYV